MHATEPYKPNLIGQTAEIIDDINAFQIMNKLELAGRVCYKSEDKIGWVNCPECHGKVHECPWKKWHKEEQIHSSFPFIKRLLHQLHHESVIEHQSITVKFVTDRGVTHEEVRHRLCSYSQESTRYVNYGKSKIKFIIPVDFYFDEEDLQFLKCVEEQYNRSLERGLSPQQARYFLINGIKTEIIHTANLREWRHIFKLRTSSKAHPQIQKLMSGLLMMFKSSIPIIFDDI